jgi:hypothetical protein
MRRHNKYPVFQIKPSYCNNPNTRRGDYGAITIGRSIALVSSITVERPSSTVSGYSSIVCGFIHTIPVRRYEVKPAVYPGSEQGLTVSVKAT